MGFLSSLKSLFSSPAASAPTYPSEQYQDFTIAPQPQPADGQYRVAAMISKTIGDQVKEHHFIRSDTCAMADDAAELALQKCKLFIDQLGDDIFN